MMTFLSRKSLPPKNVFLSVLLTLIPFKLYFKATTEQGFNAITICFCSMPAYHEHEVQSMIFFFFPGNLITR